MAAPAIRANNRCMVDSAYRSIETKRLLQTGSSEKEHMDRNCSNRTSGNGCNPSIDQQAAIQPGKVLSSQKKDRRSGFSIAISLLTDLYQVNTSRVRSKNFELKTLDNQTFARLGHMTQFSHDHTTNCVKLVIAELCAQ